MRIFPGVTPRSASWLASARSRTWVPRPREPETSEREPPIWRLLANKTVCARGRYALS